MSTEEQQGLNEAMSVFNRFSATKSINFIIIKEIKEIDRKGNNIQKPTVVNPLCQHRCSFWLCH
ncbi:uncharacterized protein Bfra_002795 [Botrytis fragariae]|uniref:Uncharacterized protein n=1 Tax=Botrytis fragariae TaxID=1964551 RepID=A0A8H6EL92_9HELO|nr:uncharacterized protein Bfra_002795 [Botrytis fragariae]KAF5876391.1 hypothetical protein Bfra_002795 [Botrytis fragariae]